MNYLNKEVTANVEKVNDKKIHYYLHHKYLLSF